MIWNFFYICFPVHPIHSSKFVSEISSSIRPIHYKFIDHTFAGYIVHLVIVHLIARFGDFVLSMLWVHIKENCIVHHVFTVVLNEVIINDE